MLGGTPATSSPSASAVRSNAPCDLVRALVPSGIVSNRCNLGKASSLWPPTKKSGRVQVLHCDRQGVGHLLSIRANLDTVETVRSSQSVMGEAMITSFTSGATAKVVAVVDSESHSPFQGHPGWQEVMQHMARRLHWIEPSLEMLVYEDHVATSQSPAEDFDTALKQADILVGVGVKDVAAVTALAPYTATISTVVLFDCSDQMAALTKLGDTYPRRWTAVQKIAASLGLWSNGNKALKALTTVSDAWARSNADDIWFSVLFLINEYVTEVPMLKNMRAKDFDTLQCMVGNCGSEIGACMLDSTCRKALTCLTSCGPTDQVCSYRCIVSYESPLLEAFSLCILQKHNCLGLNAEIRMRPEVLAMPSFRGQPMTHSLAEDLFVGWLGNLEWSWRVVAGQNAAYDQFPCQYQIFYRGKAKNSMWYDPVFQVSTLDGKTVWRRRHYRVRRAEVPGTFYFSVLDNGVISKEFWRIVDVCEDLSWGLFYYSGAAAAAGQSYTGAVLVTPDGNWPGERHEERLLLALDSCGIKLWELFRVPGVAICGLARALPSSQGLGALSVQAYGQVNGERLEITVALDSLCGSI
eukprot:SM000163S02334  [mRNA]  locus=s163:300101:303983:- [translate_table: standard]